MGACGSSTKNRASQSSLSSSNNSSRKQKKLLKARDINPQQAERYIRRRSHQNGPAPPVKILILGAGETGKTTFFKQIGMLYGINPLLQNGDDIRTQIRTNIVDAICALAKNADNLDDRYNARISGVAARASKTELLSILSSGSSSSGFIHSDQVRLTLLKHLKNLWSDEGIQNAYKAKHVFHLSFDNLPYFMSKIDQVFDKVYVPSVEDVLRSRTRTTGINQIEFCSRNNNGNEEQQQRSKGLPSKFSFRLIDVGGQRGERRKWLRFLDDIDAIVFLSAISAYDETLFEDVNVNRLHEDLKIFDDICKNTWSKSITLFLLLNKKDVFEKKFDIQRFKQTFPQFQGNNASEACQFLRQEFESKNKRNSFTITTLNTCALDSQEVEQVFSIVIGELLEQKMLESNSFIA